MLNVSSAITARIYSLEGFKVDSDVDAPIQIVVAEEKSISGSVIVYSQIMARRLLAQLIVMGTTMLGRAVVQAYRQALANAAKSGVAQETLQNTVRSGSKKMTEKEARMILGVSEGSSLDEILKKYNALFENNQKNGSFYLQSKVQRAKEVLEEIYSKDQGSNG